MKKMYKIFGAVAIIGLFLLGSVASTSMAAPRQQNPVVQQEESLQRQAQPQQPQQQYVVAIYDDEAYPLGPDYPDESCAYNPYTTPLFGQDLATTTIACFPLTDLLWIRVRNVGVPGSGLSSGATIKIKVYAFATMHGLPIFNAKDAVVALPPWTLAQNFIKGPVPFTQPAHLVTSRIKLPFGVWEGFLRSFNFRIGLVQDII